ncbi:MAG TPA: hypothetical protein VLB04_06660, partial [Methanotrichaceae archaeon]|nr:hypothetical protein [Methanotrichaceae archaeon]
MPIASPSQRLGEISKALETLRAQSLDHPDKAVEMLPDGLEQLQVSLKELTISAGGGMTETERDAFVEDKLACEHEKSLAHQEKLLDATKKVLAQKDLMGLLQTAADAVRALTGSKYAVTGHGYVNGVFIAGGVSHSKGAMP